MNDIWYVKDFVTIFSLMHLHSYGRISGIDKIFQVTTCAYVVMKCLLGCVLQTSLPTYQDPSVNWA